MLDVFAAFGLAASAGLNAYIPLLIVAICGKVGWITLSEPFNQLTDWWAIGVLVVLVVIEALVDKVPAIDTLNDIINTFIRPAAGAILFAASAHVITDVSPVLSIILGILVAGSVHGMKATARPVITVATAGTGNALVSTGEDIVAAIVSVLAILLPWLSILCATTGIVIFLVWRMSQTGRKKAAES